MERYRYYNGGMKVDNAEGPYVLYTDAQAQIEAVQKQIEGVEQGCLRDHVDTEVANAKIMQLEGERGMWLTERVDLLSRLEVAESKLAQHQQQVEALQQSRTCAETYLPIIAGLFGVQSAHPQGSSGWGEDVCNAVREANELGKAIGWPKGGDSE